MGSPAYLTKVSPKISEWMQCRNPLILIDKSKKYRYETHLAELFFCLDTACTLKAKCFSFCIMEPRLKVVFSGRGSASRGPFIKDCKFTASVAFYVEDKFILRTKYAVIAAVCSRKEFLEVALYNESFLIRPPDLRKF